IGITRTRPVMTRKRAVKSSWEDLGAPSVMAGLSRPSRQERRRPASFPSEVLEHRAEKWIRFSLARRFGSALNDALVKGRSIGLIPNVQVHFWVRCFSADS